MKSDIHSQRVLMSNMSHCVCCMSSVVTLLPMRTRLNQRAATYRLVNATRLSLSRACVAGRNIEATDSDLTVPISCSAWDTSDENDDWSLLRSLLSRLFEKRAPRQQLATTRRNRSSSLYVLRSPRSNSRTLALSSCTSVRNAAHNAQNQTRSRTLRVLKIW